jgi:hypothetical protein
MFASGIRSATYDGTRRRGLSNVAACNAWFKTLKQNQIRVDCFGVMVSKLSCTAAGACQRPAARHTTIPENCQKP